MNVEKADSGGSAPGKDTRLPWRPKKPGARVSQIQGAGLAAGRNASSAPETQLASGPAKEFQ